MHDKLITLIILASIISVIIGWILKKIKENFQTKLQLRKKQNNSDWPDSDLKKVKVIKLNSCQHHVQQSHSESNTTCSCGQTLIISEKASHNHCHEFHNHHCHHSEKHHGENCSNYQWNNVNVWLLLTPITILACFCCFVCVRKRLKLK